MSQPDAFPAAAGAVNTARAAVRVVRDTELWKMTDPDLLGLARELEHLARLVFTAQVHLAGEIDTRGTAATHGAPSTAALLRASLSVSHGDARTMVATAAAVLPRDLPTGGDLPPALPLLAQALRGGEIGLAQTRTIVATMSNLPPTVDEQTRAVCEQHLVAHGKLTEPAPFAVFARAILLTLDQDGRDFDQDPPADHVEFTIGARNPNTGLTRVTGQLDDLGVEIVNQAINALAKPTTTPTPGTGTGTGGAGASGGTSGDGASSGTSGGGDLGGTGNGGMGCGNNADPSGGGGNLDGTGSGRRITDPRPAATRRAQALLEALRRYLDLGQGPTHGAERPHITVTMTLQDLLGPTHHPTSDDTSGGACPCGRTNAAGNRTGNGLNIAGHADDTGGTNSGTPSTGRSGTRSAQLEYGGPITAAQARTLACDARIIPAVLGTASQVLDIGTTNRFFPPHIRRAITLRDKGCTFPGCDRPPGFTDAHHITYWTNHGPSAYHNGTLLCRHHHSEIHRGHWTIHIATDGTPEYTPPPWIDPTRTPQRNTSHHIPTLLQLRACDELT